MSVMKLSEEETTILVVDDDPKILYSMTLVLENAGYNVVQAQTGEETLAQAREHAPDLILLDVMLPALDGMEVCRRLKTDPATADCCVILISGVRRRSEEQAEGLELGADGYIARPVSNRELLARVYVLLRQKKIEDALQTRQEELEELLEESTQMLETYRNATVDREVRMAELKDVIHRLQEQLEEAGLDPRADERGAK